MKRLYEVLKEIFLNVGNRCAKAFLRIKIFKKFWNVLGKF